MALTLGTPTTATGLDTSSVSDDWKFINLTTDKGVYIYWNSTLSEVVGRVVTSSGTSISTIGAEKSIITESTAFRSWRPVRMSDTGFVVIYGLGTGGIKAVACTVSGTTISAGSQTVIDSSADINTSDDVFGARVADDKAIAVYMDRNNGTKGTATAFTVSGTTINTPGTPHVYESTGGNIYMGADDFHDDGTHVLATHIRSNTVYAIVLAVTGTTVSNGTEISISAGVTTKVRARAVGLTATDGFIIYEQASGARAGKVRAVSRSGTTLTAGSTTVDWATDTSSNIPQDACRQADDLALLIYSEGNNLLEIVREIQLVAGEPNLDTPLTLTDPSEVENMGVAKANATTAMVIYSTDQIAVVTSDLAPTVTPFRFLGMDADNGTLLVTGLNNAATLQLFEYTDLASLTESGTTSFGSATDTELDNLERGIFPVVRPEGDGIWYLFGRDGNDVQAQYNDDNGTLGWVDIGPGTATWGTAKYAVALMPAPFDPDDVIIAFDDDDVYRARYGTAVWVKMGDATSGLRAAARHPIRFNELLAGGTAAGTVLFSHNFGVSWADVSGTALGTINAFEVSL